MMLELDVSDNLVKKIRALNQLVGGDPRSLPTYIVSLLDKTVSAAIIEMVESPLNVEPPAAARIIRRKPLVTPRQQQSYDPAPHYEPDDMSGISAGLGDDEPEDDEADESQKLRPEEDPARSTVKGGITEDDLDKDMEVADPEHEAKMDAPKLNNSGKSPEEEFLDLTDIRRPKPIVGATPIDDQPGRKGLRSRRFNKGKAKVTEATEISETF